MNIITSPSSLCHSHLASPPFTGAGGGYISPRVLLGIGKSKHQHQLKLNPSFGLTEYEERYKDPRSVSPECYKEGLKSVHSRKERMPDSPAARATSTSLFSSIIKPNPYYDYNMTPPKTSKPPPRFTKSVVDKGTEINKNDEALLLKVPKFAG